MVVEPLVERIPGRRVQQEGDVPEVLKGGNHGEIARWRRMQSLGQTWLKRPDLLAKLTLSKVDAKLLAEFQSNIKAQS